MRYKQCFIVLVMLLFALGGYAQDIKFIENKNQWPEEIDFAARVSGGSMFIKPGGFNYYFLDRQKIDELHDKAHANNSEASLKREIQSVDGQMIQVNFLGSNSSAQPQPFNQLEPYYNYFLGTDPSKHASKARAYEGVYYSSFYDCIDLKLYSSGDFIKYDFFVAPGADPNLIRIKYSGADQISVMNGDVVINTPVVSIFEKSPTAFQEIDGQKVAVKCEYRLENGIIAFNFPEGYNSCYELVIDPLLIFSTYSGSTADNWGSTATPGEHGTLYSSGTTNEYPDIPSLSGKFPATAGAFQTTYGGLFDVAVLKYDSTGKRLLYASYLGGVNSESPHSLLVNKNNELLILGTTSSEDFPTSVTAFDRSFNGGTIESGVVDYEIGSDIFVAKLSSDGSQLLSSTYLGGTQNDGLNPSGGVLTVNYGDAQRGDILSDNDGNIFVSTVTSSPDFPVINSFSTTYGGGATDALVLKIKPDLSQITWGAFIGGSSTDASHTIKLDNSGNVFIAGGTASTDFPTTAGVYQSANAGSADGWIGKISNDGATLLSSTLTGTPSFNQIYFLELSSNDDVYVYGQTDGVFPVTSGVYSNPISGQFIQKFSSDLTTLKLSTVFGSGRGIPDISPTAFLVNDCNNIYVSGWGGAINTGEGFWDGSSTFGMPISSDAYQKTTRGSDFYFMVLADDATTFLYGTYLGGTLSKTHVDGGTSRFDKAGVVYHAVCAGCQAFNPTGRPTSDFPTTPGAWSRTNNSKNCNNAAFKFDLSSLKARIQTNSVNLKNPGLSRVCMPDKIVFQNRSIGGESFEWKLGDGTTIIKSDTSAITHQYLAPGQYVVKLKAFDPGTCLEKDSTSTVVNVNKAQGKAGSDGSICFGSSIQLPATGGLTYAWKDSKGLFSSSEQSPVVTPAVTTIYFVTITDVNGCIAKDTVNVKVVPILKAKLQTNAIDLKHPGLSQVCIPDKIVFQNKSTGGETFEWDLGDGTKVLKSDTSAITHQYKQPGAYRVKLTAIAPQTCQGKDSTSTIVNVNKAQGKAGSDATVCYANSIELVATGGTMYSWKDVKGAVVSTSSSLIVTPVAAVSYFVTITDLNGCVAKDTVNLKVIPVVNVEFEVSRIFNCDDRPTVKIKNLSDSTESTFVDFGDGNSSDQKDIIYNYKKDGNYPIRVVGMKASCIYEKKIMLPVYSLFIPNVITPTSSPGFNDSFRIKYGDQYISETDIVVSFVVYDRWGIKVFEDKNYKENWTADNLPAGVYYYDVEIGGEKVCKSWVEVIK